MVKAVFFDLDGTLLHTLVSIKNSGDRALERYGHDRLPLEKYKEFVGDGPRILIERAFGYYGDTNEKHLEAATKSYIEYFHRNYNAAVEQYVGMYDSVRDIKEMGIKLAVLSNKDQRAAEGNIQRFFGMELFDKIVAYTGEGFVKKPAPDEALKLAKYFDAEPEECVMVGDSEPDILVAKNAGMKSVGVLWGYRSEDELKACGPDFIATKHEELPLIIEKINKDI